ncbi:phage minor head protein [Roseovarius sp. EGI FJ00037]|uniref:phage minor head protein n=1 Tax=Roseovarius salincola TaxID=2978479 RepID=UPI0022A7FC73|nr:phage minor head protein [Roseovarius sp. EGI FJ00037]MCZ0810930.1 phage minor head protein [Roseovarius sp. EGI FJ00037]
MQHSLREFLRHGGSGQYVFARQNGAVYGYRTGISIKSLFPGYADLRADFAEQLDRVIAENSRMLLNALTPPDTVPWVTEADLRDVLDAKEEALRQWDARLTAIFEEYETHPQRLRPLRAAMEERLLRAFAGLINQLRQQELGIEQYIWRSQDDTKVRDSHAEYDDQVFRWDEPPEDGHPGQAHNCRCYAEPVSPSTPDDVTLVDYVPTAGGYPLQDLAEHEAGGGHSIELHVGKSEAFLIGMVTVPQAQTLFYTVYRWRHGSFSSLAAAERLTNANLSRNADIVNAVATGRLEDAFITSTFSSITGQEAYRLTRRASSPIRLRTTYGVGTYIRHAPDMPNGFIIITSYPRDE